jgi:hypothetical protein
MSANKLIAGERMKICKIIVNFKKKCISIIKEIIVKLKNTTKI